MHESDSWPSGGPHYGRSQMSFEELPEFLTIEEAAAVLRIGRTSAYLLAQQWRHSGGRSGLPVQRLGRLLRVPRSAIERMALSPGDAR
jgi:Helix-turn-helix domain